MSKLLTTTFKVLPVALVGKGNQGAPRVPSVGLLAAPGLGLGVKMLGTSISTLAVPAVRSLEVKKELSQGVVS